MTPKKTDDESIAESLKRYFDSTLGFEVLNVEGEDTVSFTSRARQRFSSLVEEWEGKSFNISPYRKRRRLEALTGVKFVVPSPTLQSRSPERV